ncbi:uncharacterized protein LOC113234718 isoform X2 [Hyposmocoma kahamanoa]|uniref:uncharacterized protein LOC113234718 isoform X2 n=1 Tax=Hyposmocoma kahamanoa TaxID=1477025 RepID=UPI000E6D70E0|nr:uncharacterized protein LOC113234718 isoform X2 [Hyposmocoma kahamanoa]
MLISRVEEEEGLVNGQEATENSVDDSHDYQTASELFDLMAKKYNYQSHETESLTARDLILLYKNIDLGTKLMSSANEIKRNVPNQYVETVVYREDSESDLSEICSNEDLHNVVLINKERLDLLQNSSSTFGNTLCHKFGNLEIHSSNLAKQYERTFIMKDSFNNLQGLNLMSSSKGLDSMVLPGSIFDYISCKRLEDNSYSFYMDSVIRYVNNTIDHLKRISNGEYLTDKAKKKWKEVDRVIKDSESNKSIVLSSSVSIPLHVEPKLIKNISTWEDIAHSEVNLKSLSKILEKKIVVEFPNTICGSFKLFNKCFDNLVTRPKKKQQAVLYHNDEERESRVNVVLQLKHSKSGQVTNTISSVMILHKNMDNDCTSKVLPLPYEDCNTENIIIDNQEPKICKIEENLIRNIEASNDCNENGTLLGDENTDENRKNLDDTVTLSSIDHSVDGSSEIEYTTGYGSSPTEHLSTYPGSSESSLLGTGYKRHNRFKVASFKASSDDYLKLTIQRLSTQGCLPEESLEELACGFNKKNTPTRNRLKSPYENKSHAIEERKRKKLLEIRQRREKKKMAMIETYKASKNKHGREFISQPSNSVTKLSITNKSFYNSIYGQSPNDRQLKIKNRKQKKDFSFEEASDIEKENADDITTPDLNCQKYINKNYFLDDTVTEMMYIEMNQKEPDRQEPKSESLLLNDFNSKLDILSQLITPSITDLGVPDTVSNIPFEDYSRFEVHDVTEANNKQEINTTSYLQTVVNEASEKATKSIKFQFETEQSKKNRSSIEFRKSIDKIYELMNKLGKMPDNKLCKSKFTAVQTGRDYITRHSSPTAESCSNIKDQTSTIPSNLSKEKIENPEKTLNQDLGKLKTSQKIQSPPIVVPKIVINSKSQAPKGDGEKTKKDRKKINPSKAAPEHPLKAISQILHEIDNAQKNRYKPGTIDNKPKKAEVVSAEGKLATRQSSLKKSFADNKTSSAAREKWTKSSDPKLYHQQPPTDDKHMNRSIKKQVADLMDEFKEARGEAIRGPKPSARLNSLAQPKRTYVQAQIEEFQARHGKTIMSDRLLRFTGSPSLDTSTKSRFRRVDATGSAKYSSVLPAPPPTERTSKSKASSSSREIRTPQSSNEKSLRQHNVSGTLTKKMVAVESYLKNHYGHPTPLVDNKELLRNGQKTSASRVPTDFKLSAIPSLLEENCFLLDGNKFHTIDNLTPCPTGLGVVTECNETTYEQNRDNNDESDITNDGYLQNNLETTVSRQHIPNFENTSKHDLHSPPVYAIEKQLKIGNFPMPPKDQMQKIYELILQSNSPQSCSDLEYIVTNTVNSPISQSSHVIKSKSDVFKDMTTLASLTKIDFGFPTFSMPITTIGYCFPQYRSIPSTSSASAIPAITSNTNNCGISRNGLFKSDKTCQCFKGKIEAVVEHAVQTEYKTIARNSTVNAASYTSPQSKGHDVLQCLPKTEIFELKNSSTVLKAPNKSVQKKISITAIEKLRQLDSKGSLCSFYLTNNSDVDLMDKLRLKDNIAKPLSVDREVTVELLPRKELINTCTEVPSRFLPNSVNHATDISHSLIGIISEPSTPSMLTYGEHILHSSASLTSLKKIIELKQNVKNKVQISKATRRISKKSMENSNYASTGGSENQTSAICTTKKITPNSPHYQTVQTEFDPIMKMKRDLLVTMYSVLVFTVFAALSFPEMLYRS